MVMDQETKRHTAKYVAEFVGTYLLVFTVGCNVVNGNAVWGVLAIASVLTVLIYAFAEVSGSNFNPAVSIALGVSGQLNWHDVIIYVILQLFGGISGALSYVALYGKQIYFGPVLGFTWWQAGLAELLYTFLLVFVVLNTAVARKPKGGQFFGLAIGFTVVAGGYGAGAISGGCFNPAIALGIDSVYYGGLGWGLMYIGFQLMGGALAAALFHVCRPEVYRRYTIAKVIGVPITALTAEFIGTFMLVLTIGLNVMASSAAAALSITAALMCSIFALGDVSGAHFNPAVTLACVISHRGVCSVKRGLMYAFVQIFAAILAAVTFMTMHSWRPCFPLGPPDYSNWFSAAAVEVFFTFVLCYVVLCTATVDKALSQYFGLAIGACILVGAFAVGTVSGGTMNPAASIAVAFIELLTGPLGVWTRIFNFVWYSVVFSLLECLGAGLACLTFYFSHPAEHIKAF